VLASLADALDTEIDSFFTETGEDPEDGRSLRIRRLRAELVRSGRDDLAADLAELTRQLDERTLVEPATGAGAGSTNVRERLRR